MNRQDNYKTNSYITECIQLLSSRYPMICSLIQWLLQCTTNRYVRYLENGAHFYHAFVAINQL